MKMLFLLIKRNMRMFFKDFGMFFTSLITPLILLLLYATFLSNVYRDTFLAQLGSFEVSDEIIGGLVGGQLFSSLLAVSCVTVAFCSNLLMVQDRVSGARRDLLIAPVRRSRLAVAYYVATLAVTLLIALFAMLASMIYLAIVGWYLSFADVLLLLLDIVLLVMFGTALSSVVNYFLTSQGQMSAVGTIVSSCYGFLCGAYMPISSFSEGLQGALSFLPGTYATSLLRNHALRGAFAELEASGVPGELISAMRDGVDCNLYFFGAQVREGVMYAVLGGAVLLFFGIFLLINRLDKRKI